MNHRVWIVLSLAVVALGCKKPDSTTATPAGAAPDSPGATVAVQGGQVSTREEDGLTRYSDEGPEIGTVFTNKAVRIRKAADQVSDTVKQLGPGTGVNKKARHGAYYLVDFPTGNPGEMKPGWLEQTDVTGTPVAAHTTVTPVVIPTVVPTVTTPPAGVPPRITIPGKH